MSRRRAQRGANAVEYALMVSLIVVVIIAAVTFLGQRTSGMFQKTCDSMAASTNSATC